MEYFAPGFAAAIANILSFDSTTSSTVPGHRISATKRNSCQKQNLKPKFRSSPHGLIKVGLPFPRRMKVLTYIDFDGHFGFDAKAVYIYGIDALWTIYAYAE